MFCCSYIDHRENTNDFTIVRIVVSCHVMLKSKQKINCSFIVKIILLSIVVLCLLRFSVVMLLSC